MTDLTGGCACGAVRFKITTPLMGVGACHCRDCQKASGGGPNYSALAPASALVVLQGEPSTFVSKGDSGADAERTFCAGCGTPLWSRPAGQPVVAIKLGAFDADPGLGPQMHMYVSSAPPWHPRNEGLPQFDGMPPADLLS